MGQTHTRRGSICQYSNNDFMIVSMARSGTSFLRNIINSVEGYHRLGDIFRRSGDSLEELSRLLACTESEILKRISFTSSVVTRLSCWSRSH